MLINHLNILH